MKTVIEPSLNRRKFVALCGASAALPSDVLAQSVRPTNPDVVIVGAGAAGIAAAHQLRALGISYLHVEAADRIGGRAHSETATFGVPYDPGAHWMHNGTRNPYHQRAADSGYRHYAAPEKYGIYTENGPATAAEEAELWDMWDAVENAISKAGRRGRDVAPASVAPSDGVWARTAWYGLGPWEMGANMDSFSCLDWYQSADGTDWYCAEGFGQLVADHAKGLDVALNTPVQSIRWGGTGVEVETSAGTITAKAVILTVSTGVLAQEGITFDPPLPVEKQQSFHSIAMGHYNHIAVQFDQDIFGLGEDGLVLHRVGADGAAFGALSNASGSGLTYCDVGGSFARELEIAGEAAAVDFTLGTLRDLIGSDVDKHLIKTAVTAWGNDPFVRGSYAAARPGAYPMRAVLRQPVAERIFFAGEACHVDMWATVGGADLSGSQVAAEVAELLK